MQKQVLVAALLVGIAGCSSGAQLPQDQGSNSAGSGGLVDELSAAFTPSAWSIEKVSSGIDGETYTATRVYSFPDRQTQLQATASCVAGTGISELVIDSYLGAPENPHDGSAFVTSTNGFGFQVATGRVKSVDGSVADLSSYFTLGVDYNNRLMFDFNNPISQAAIPQAPGYSSLASMVEEGDINYARLLLAAVPMTVEVKNGAGLFELEIDRSEELTEALQACGAGSALLTEQYVTRVQEVEQRERSAALDALKGICLSRGQINKSLVTDSFRMGSRSDEFLAKIEHFSIPLDCATSAPDELSKFSANIDGYLLRAQEQGTPCSRDALLKSAAEMGLDEAVWDMYLKSYCQA
ncbi:hypothetical protein [Lysobacter sp. D1-1-M9]|uniref:hypothetical protein n=1 Tax=Novilysobacter longmucuonensis TaxID=3098603 RepID=UPI002FC5D57F